MVISIIAPITALDTLIINNHFAVLRGKEFMIQHQIDLPTQPLTSADKLTGLWDRRAFLGLAAEMFERSSESSLGMAAILLDLDRIKRVNKAFGRPAGDVALQTVARILVETVRPQDLCGRYRSAEFAVLLQCPALADACRMGERVRARVHSQPLLADGQEIPLTISLGVFFTRGTLPSVDALLSRARQALLRAKYNGRDCWVCEEEP
jgi:diguanylate cyclase (GGDEF)-like protein